MSSFDHTQLKEEYDNEEGSIAQDFIVPCLKNCVRYRRATYDFTSAALKRWAGSLTHIIKNNVQIEILCDMTVLCQTEEKLRIAFENSLSEEKRESFIREYQNGIELAAFAFDKNSKDSRLRQKILDWLIHNKQLKIKFAYPKVKPPPHVGIKYHKKMGYFEFPDNTHVAFKGSWNETYLGGGDNGEECDVYSSEKSEDKSRCRRTITKVDNDWDNENKKFLNFEISKELMKLIKERAPKSANEILEEFPDLYSLLDQNEEETSDTPDTEGQSVDPEVKKRWGHQEKALRSFIFSEKNEYSVDENIDKRKEGFTKGILEMATGTGKTRTAFSIAEKLYQNGKINKVLIVPPNKKSLCTQWGQEVVDWRNNRNLNNLRFYKHYFDVEKNIDHKEVERFISKEKDCILIAKREFELLDYVLKKIDKEKTLVVHDEVHGFGAPGFKNLKGIQKDFKFTLGLSATPEREYDQDGTDFINEEIGSPIFEYPIESAIENGTLSPFRYHEIKVEQSDETSRKISAAISAFNHKKKENPNLPRKDLYTQIALIRSQDENKIPSLRYFLKREGGKSLIKNSIIYCATKEQCKEVGPILNELGFSFTYNFSENPAEQQKSLDELENNRIDTIINCHVLSEGIDIRSLENIIMLHSWRARLETIQRVGRCIRIDPNNPEKIANVVDLVLYKDIKTNDNITSEIERRDWLLAVSQIREHKDG